MLMGLLSGFVESFLDEWCGRGRLLRDNAVLAEDVVPANDEISSCQLKGCFQLLTTPYRHLDHPPAHSLAYPYLTVVLQRKSPRTAKSAQKALVASPSPQMQDF